MKRRWAQESGSTLPIAPLLDVIFLLLIFFVLINRYLPPTLSVSLPEASAAVLEEGSPLMLSIDSEARLMVNGSEISWEELAQVLATYEKDRQVRIAADRNTDYDYIVKAMDACAQAGLSRIALETSPATAGQ